ncbi:MAG: hypothetical protein IKQ71_01795 [Lachnospiraceae bacterium]|nr:hypothetical protein [Lachnospiraceae bacterium]
MVLKVINIILKIIVFAAVCVSVFVFTNRLSNDNLSSAYAELKNAEIPVAYVEYEGGLINVMHGYKTELDCSLLRDYLTPISSDKSIKIWVSADEGSFDTAAYEFRGMDGSLIENGDIEHTSFEDGYLKYQTSLRMDMTPMKEYFFILMLSKGEETFRYYTRIMEAEGVNVKELLDFAKSFHNETFVKNEAESFIAKKIEPSPNTVNNTLSHVTIHSDYETVTYAGMNPVEITQYVPAIREISSDSCIIGNSFVIAAGDSEITNYYNVTESYKLKKTVNSKGEPFIYLLDYDRTQDEIFNYKNANTNKNWFKIGVADSDNIDLVTADSEKKAAFVRNNQLWYYDYQNTNIARVFGFWQEDYMNINNTYNSHEIRIISLDKKGNITFSVTGYMNRGEYEGRMGIAAYRYEAETGRIISVAFVESNLPYEQLLLYSRKLTYINSANEFFFMHQDAIYKIGKSGDPQVVLSGVTRDGIVCSEDYRYITVQKDMELSENSGLTMMDLETGETVDYNAGSEERIKPIGYIGSDMVCGMARSEDIRINDDLSVAFPMYKVLVVDMKLETKKEYKENDIYIVGARCDGLNIYFDRAERIGNAYKPVAEDFITFKDSEDDASVVFEDRFSNTSLNLVYMVFPAHIYIKAIPRLMITKEFVGEEKKETLVEAKDDLKLYYVYNTSGLSSDHRTAGAALKEALTENGIALNSKGERIWSKIDIEEFNTVTDRVSMVNTSEVSKSLSACLTMAVRYAGGDVSLSEPVPFKEGEEHIFDEQVGKSGLMFTGVDLNTMLYYLSQGVPFITDIGGEHFVLVTSYNALSVRYIDPLEPESVKLDRSTFNKKMTAAGGKCISYIP